MQKNENIPICLYPCSCFALSRLGNFWKLNIHWKKCPACHFAFVIYATETKGRKKIKLAVLQCLLNSKCTHCWCKISLLLLFSQSSFVCVFACWCDLQSSSSCDWSHKIPFDCIDSLDVSWGKELFFLKL